MANIVYYGSEKCQGFTASGKKCNNKTYFRSQGKYLCGVHSKKDKDRKQLEKDPNAKKNRELLLKARQDKVEEVAHENREAGREGRVICEGLRIMKEVPHHDGYLKIFPNFKHQNRNDGVGMKSLSPMSLGPIDHGQPGLPVALNLENFHQQSKMYKAEADEDGHVTKKFIKGQKNGFLDPIPHRHKSVDGKSMKGQVPVGWVWTREDGTKVYYTYVECRQFYCNYFERLASKENDFKALQKMIRDGYNLQITGYDGYPVGESIMEHYLDPTRPFGHEMVIYTMLVVKNKEDYPWRVHKTEDF
jgi:hypothetical protein